MIDTIGHEGVGLEELAEGAALMTRVDRKYLVPLATARGLTEALRGKARVLDIDGRRTFCYRSTYYDTATLECYRAASGGRRHRFKVRSREYVDTATSHLEVKALTGRGESAKQRAPLASPTAADDALGAPELAFVRQALREAGCAPPVGELLPVLRTAYDRITLYLEHEGSRLTVDQSLAWSEPGTRRPDVPRRLWVDDLVVVESKGGQRPGTADRLLWAMGHRPVRISKYATGLALLHPELPANRWHRTLRVLQAGTAPAAAPTTPRSPLGEPPSADETMEKETR